MSTLKEKKILRLKPQDNGATKKINLNDDEIEWLSKNYPELNLVKGEDFDVIKGNFIFKASFNTESKKIIINPTGNFFNEYLIEDQYEIEIPMYFKEKSTFPPIKEIGNRMINFSLFNKINPADLHINKDTSLCLCSPILEEYYLPNEFNLRNFINNLLIPFFYSNSYFEKTRKRLWKDYYHGFLGIIQSYKNIQRPITSAKILEVIDSIKFFCAKDAEITNINKFNSIKEQLKKKKVKGKQSCYCGSNKTLLNCHPEALEGLQLLNMDIKEKKITFDYLLK